ncbi:MAG: type III PLP-dependent enzyme [Kordiimonadaceae bacterium]|nr:type III PLP-dependent enzyme [Kordiimonadaceae bacterium]
MKTLEYSQYYTEEKRDLVSNGKFDFLSLPEAVASLKSEVPIYVIYPEVIKTRAEYFINNFPGRVMFAVKANPNVTVLKCLWDAGIRHFDVASINEVNLVAGLLPEAKMYFMHPVKSRKAIRDSYAMGIRHYAVDSMDELNKIIEETNKATDLVIHIRILLENQSAAYDLSGKFGASESCAVNLLKQASQYSNRLGITFHVGSQTMDSSAYRKALGVTKTIIDKADVPVEFVDVGGGFPVAYPGMASAPLSSYFNQIEEAMAEFGLDYLELVGEPGRALVAEGGSTLARVELRRGNDLYLNEGVYGSFFDAGTPEWRYPTSRIGMNNKHETIAEYRFFGPTCDSIDTMVGPFHLPANIKEGDWIEVANLGAYGQAMATHFNGFQSDITIAVPGFPAHLKFVENNT